MKKKVTLINIVCSLMVQFLTILSGIIIPRFILINFGSELNGLVSSLTQFLNIVAILEGGVTGVIMANLYSPLIKKDYTKISSILKTTSLFYKKISIIFVLYSIVLSIAYPIFLETNYSFCFVSSLILIISFGIFIQYNFSFTLKTLLNTDKKGYIVYIVQSVIIILNLILAIISLKIFKDIHILKLIESILFIIQPIIYKRYVKRRYKLDDKVVLDKDLVKNRWSGFGINIAAYIHASTDVIILTIFAGLKYVSIYNIYYMVISGIKKIVISISGAMNSSIGHLFYRENNKAFEKKFNCYEFVIFFLVFFLLSVTSLLITPFVMMYTKGINDISYFNPLFGYLFVLTEAIYLLREPHVNLSYSANRFKEICKPAYIEAFINLLFSIILVRKYGLIGIVVGTLISVTFRTIWQAVYTKKIIDRKIGSFFIKMLIFGVGYIISTLICLRVSHVEYEITSLIFHGILYSFIYFMVYTLLSFIFYKKEIKILKEYIKNK